MQDFGGVFLSESRLDLQGKNKTTRNIAYA